MFKKWFKQLICSHEDLVFVRNIHGEEIIVSGFYRSIYKCKSCGKVIYIRRLDLNGGSRIW